MMAVFYGSDKKVVAYTLRNIMKATTTIEEILSISTGFDAANSLVTIGNSLLTSTETD